MTNGISGHLSNAGNTALQTVVAGNLSRPNHAPPHIRRLMTAAQFRAQMGSDPKPGEKKSTRYKAILAEVVAFHRLRNDYPSRLIEVARDRRPEKVATHHSRFQTEILTKLTAIKDLCGTYVQGRGGLLKSGVKKVTSRQATRSSRLRKEAAVSALRNEAEQEYAITADALIQIKRQYLDNLLQPGFKNVPRGPALGAGANSTAYSADINAGDLILRGVFKAEPEGQHSDGTENAGIVEQNTMGNFRSVATYRLAKLLLGDDQTLVPRTELAVSNGELGQWMGLASGKAAAKETVRNPNANELEDLQRRLARLARYRADRARAVREGTSTADLDMYIDGETKQLDRLYPLHGPAQQRGVKETKILDIDPNSGELQQQLSQLHILDLIAGQVDRHEQNYWIESNQGRITVTTIDSDLAFGSKDIDLTRGLASLPGLPPIVDRALAGRILGEPHGPAITEDDVANAVAGLLVPEEVAKLKSRFSITKAHLRSKWDANQTATTANPPPGSTTWGASTKDMQTRNDSYFGRLHDAYQTAQQYQLLYQ